MSAGLWAAWLIGADRPHAQRVAPVAPSTGQAQSALETHLASARAAAAADFGELFATTCGLVISYPTIAAPAAAPQQGAVARAGWHAEPAKVFDNLYFVGQTEYSA